MGDNLCFDCSVCVLVSIWFGDFIVLNNSILTESNTIIINQKLTITY